MEKELKERVARYVQGVGAEKAIDVAEIILSENSKGIEKYSDPNAIMAQLKIQLSVLEYLHCDSEVVEKYEAAML